MLKVTNKSLRSIIEERLIPQDKIKVDVLDLSDLDTSEVTDMYNLFGFSIIKRIVGIDNWDVSHVTNMSKMFSQSKMSNIGNLSKWDTSNVVNMDYMFYDSSIYYMGDISNWQTHNVLSMQAMFNKSNVNAIGDLSKWDISKVSDTFLLFANSDLDNQFYIENRQILLRENRFTTSISRESVDLELLLEYLKRTTPVSLWESLSGSTEIEKINNLIRR